jgi:hypothetical protein
VPPIQRVLIRQSQASDVHLVGLSIISNTTYIYNHYALEAGLTVAEYVQIFHEVGFRYASSGLTLNGMARMLIARNAGFLVTTICQHRHNDSTPFQSNRTDSNRRTHLKDVYIMQPRRKVTKYMKR